MRARTLRLLAGFDRALTETFGRVPLTRSRRFAKRHDELRYWRTRLADEGRLVGPYYERFYTEHFGLTRADYAGKHVLDIGCGPRGSLDWATDAAERIGLDPLASEYVRLAGQRDGMTYVTGVAEAIPFPDGHFDIVTTFNSLDHVDDVDGVIAEITRVTRAGGLLLILTDVGHEATFSEPQTFSWEIVERFRDEWDVLAERRFVRVAQNMMATLDAAIPFDRVVHGDATGTLSAQLRRR